MAAKCRQCAASKQSPISRVGHHIRNSARNTFLPSNHSCNSVCVHVVCAFAPLRNYCTVLGAPLHANSSAITTKKIVCFFSPDPIINHWNGDERKPGWRMATDALWLFSVKLSFKCKISLFDLHLINCFTWNVQIVRRHVVLVWCEKGKRNWEMKNEMHTFTSDCNRSGHIAQFYNFSLSRFLFICLRIVFSVSAAANAEGNWYRNCLGKCNWF